MQLSSSEKALYVKIVYYGPGLSGKTTNLETIHRLTDPDRKQPMVSLRTEQDRTLFFDLLPFDLGRIYGLDVRLKLYTVPGQIQYDTTRKQVLAGADGIVFVADSQPSQAAENARMVRYLKNNLQDNGLDPATIPLVFQWNKRDLPGVMPPEKMEAELNWRRVPALEAVATVGQGVIETFREIAILTLETVSSQGRGGGDPAARKEMRERIRKLLDPFVVREAVKTVPEVEPPSITHVHHTTPAGTDPAEGPARSILGLDDLLSEAVQANLAISEQLAVTAGAEEAVLSRMRRERKALGRMLQIAQVTSEPRSLCRIALSTLVAGLDLVAGSVLAPAGNGKPASEVAVVGVPRDPLNSIEVPGVGSVAASIVTRAEPLICHDIQGELLFGQPHPAVEELRSVMALPLVGVSRVPLVFLLYTGRRSRDLGAEEREFADLILGIIGLALKAATTGAPAPAGNG
ncbi:MAG: ADP-ribosylation factor-like protein [Acidobacteriota bacterium]|nr:ADP-ribosylation factor-like protein [Acidobacteriota bacterium]